MDILSSINHTGVLPHHLNLKIGTLCSIQCNLSVEHGLVKNTHVEIIKLWQRTADVRVIGKEQVHCILHINFQFHPNYSTWTINHRQLPLRPAYATTFNSCQGLTLNKIIVDLHNLVFAHGQLYTALSC